MRTNYLSYIRFFLFILLSGSLIVGCSPENFTGEPNPPSRQNSLCVTTLESNSDFFGEIEPHPTPIPKGTKIMVTGGRDDDPTPVDIIGFTGALLGPGKVIIQSAYDLVTTQATCNGSFAATVLSKAGDTVLIQYEETEALEVQVPLIYSNPKLPEPIPGIPFITVLSNDTILIRGELVGEKDIKIVGVNFTLGNLISASTITNTDGTFALELLAHSGDRIKIYNNGNPFMESTEITPTFYNLLELMVP